MTRVLPEPAPARMRSGPSVASTASPCCSFNCDRSSESTFVVAFKHTAQVRQNARRKMHFESKKQIDPFASVFYDSRAMNDQLWQAVMTRDARFDGQFVFAVSSTKVYCRPSCPSRRPRRERVTFFDIPDAAEQAGFRACLRCEPRRERVVDSRVELVQRVCRLLDANQSATVKLAELAADAGVSTFHLQRTCKRIMGISPRQYQTARRFGNFKTLVREGEPVTQALYDSGFNSSSRLYEHAPEELGMTPA